MLTIASLITPLVLATAPISITVEDHVNYSHEKQLIVSMNESQPIYSTIGGTQTFDASGKPHDSDSD